MYHTHTGTLRAISVFLFCRRLFVERLRLLHASELERAAGKVEKAGGSGSGSGTDGDRPLGVYGMCYGCLRKGGRGVGIGLQPKDSSVLALSSLTVSLAPRGLLVIGY